MRWIKKMQLCGGAAAQLMSNHWLEPPLLSCDLSSGQLSIKRP